MEDAARRCRVTLEGMEELFDVLDDRGVPTGETKARARVHHDGDWHRSFHLWLVKEGRYVLLQRRAQSKDLEGGKVDVTVGGHFRAGESLDEVVREVEEEIGLFVRPGDLHHLETRQVERSYPDATDREFQETFVMRCEQPLEHYYLNCKEVTVLYEISVEGALDLYRHGTPYPAAGFDCQGRTNNALLIEDDLIGQARADVVETLEKIKAWTEKLD